MYLEYDTAGRIKYRPDSDLLRLISEVVGAGYGDRILLGLDLGRRDYFRAYDGGPGMRYLMATFVPRLEHRIGAEAVHRILVDNPARAFALAPRAVIADRYDVIVVGSGSAGSSAAISAARAGAQTLLIDRLAFMGGTSTAVLDTFYAFYTPGEQPRRVVGGLGWEVVERLTAEGVAFERPNTYGAGTGVTYDQETLKVVWEQMAADSGLDLLLHTWATGVRLADGRRVRPSGSGTRAASAGSLRASSSTRPAMPICARLPGLDTRTSNRPARCSRSRRCSGLPTSPWTSRRRQRRRTYGR